MSDILEKAKEVENCIIKFRRDLHKNPELSGEEYNTQAKIMSELDKLGIEYQKAGNTSLIATLRGEKSGKTIALRGVSGHGSAPHRAKDTIHPACTFVTDLQGIVTKNIDAQKPLVLSVGKFVGGTKANVVAKYTELDITMRYFDSEVREKAHQAIKRHAEAIADAYELKVDIEIDDSTPSLYNDEGLTVLAAQSAAKVFGKDRNKTISKYMGSEDMAYYFQQVKGVYAFIGYRNEEKEAVYFPHHEKFKIDEDYMKYGTALHVQFALDFLKNRAN